MSDWRTKPTERTCRDCSTAFTGRYNSTRCGDCRAATKRRCADRFREANPDYWKQWQQTNGRTRRDRLAYTYGLTLEEWEAMHAAQGGACLICGATEGWAANAGRLVVDHCHTTGEVRGLLCPACNRGLGQFEDDSARLLAAAKYLDSRRKATP